jgi:hypothetical protein
MLQKRRDSFLQVFDSETDDLNPLHEKGAFFSSKTQFCKEVWVSPMALRFNLRIFLIPSLLMIIGGIIWSVIAIYFPTNFPLLLLGQIIFMIGMFVAIILGFWVMTLIRIPQR